MAPAQMPVDGLRKGKKKGIRCVSVALPCPVPVEALSYGVASFACDFLSFGIMNIHALIQDYKFVFLGHLLAPIVVTVSWPSLLRARRVAIPIQGHMGFAPCLDQIFALHSFIGASDCVSAPRTGRGLRMY